MPTGTLAGNKSRLNWKRFFFSTAKIGFGMPLFRAIGDALTICLSVWFICGTKLQIQAVIVRKAKYTRIKIKTKVNTKWQNWVLIRQLMNMSDHFPKKKKMPCLVVKLVSI